MGAMADEQPSTDQLQKAAYWAILRAAGGLVAILAIAWIVRELRDAEPKRKHDAPTPIASQPAPPSQRRTPPPAP
jgi:hypothetical protein